MKDYQPIRILHVVGIMNTGGAETLIMNIFRNVDRSKVIFDFIVHTNEKGFYDDEIRELGGRIYRIPKFTLKSSLNYIRKWNQFFQHHNEYKIIHSHIRSTASIFLWIAKKYGLNTIIHSHNTSNGKGFSAIIKDTLQLPIRYIADSFFACSREAGRYLFGNKILIRGDCEIIPNAIDTEKFFFNEVERKEIRLSLNISKDEFVIGHVGRFEYQKNHDYIIDIFDQIIKQRKDSILLLIGEGTLRPEIERKVREKGLVNNVRFLGVRSDTPLLFKGMDLFLFPSHFEGLPVTMIEAQASGLNCVISDTISKEVDMGLGKIRYVSLNKPPKEWADIVLSQMNYKRDNSIKNLVEKGFDIKKITEWLESYYIKIH